MAKEENHCEITVIVTLRKRVLVMATKLLGGRGKITSRGHKSRGSRRTTKEEDNHDHETFDDRKFVETDDGEKGHVARIPWQRRSVDA